MAATDPFAGITDQGVHDLLTQLVQGQLSPQFADEIAGQFQQSGYLPNLNPDIGKYSAATAPYYVQPSGNEGNPNAGFDANGNFITPGNDGASAQQLQEFGNLTNEFSASFPQVPGMTGLDFLSLFGPVLAGPIGGAAAGALGEGAGAVSAASGSGITGFAGSQAGSAIGGAVGGAQGAQIGGVAGGLAGGAASPGGDFGVGAVDGAADAVPSGGMSGIPGGDFGLGSLSLTGDNAFTSGGQSIASPALAGSTESALGGIGLGAALGGGPGGGASGASALEGGSPSNTSPAPTTGSSSAFGNLGASNPITGQAPDASGLDATSGSSTAPGAASPAATPAGSPAFNPTTGTSGSPGSATGTSMDFSQLASPILDVANQASGNAPAGMDSIASANFNAENTSNPALATSLENSGLSGPAPGGGFQGSDILKFIKSNPNLLLGGAGLGISALNKPKIPNINNLTADANSADATANGLINAEQTGQLPPGQQQMVQSALSDSIAGIKAKYANMNLSGSSSEQQEISAAQERAAATTAQLATQVTGQGLTALQLSEQIYAQIANIKLQEDQGLQNAIAQFSGAAALGAGQQLIKSA